MVYVILLIIILKHVEELFNNINTGDTPFTMDNVKHIKMMAILMIALIVLPNICGPFFEVIMSTDLDVGIEVFDLVEILIVFSMAYIFEYGYEIQLDSKGRMYGDENE